MKQADKNPGLTIFQRRAALSAMALPTSVQTPGTIEERAASILRSHGLYSVPVDPVVLANKDGIKVFNAKFSDGSLSGLVTRRKDLTTILVNQGEPPFRKRFTIAHELGHHFLHLLDGDGEFEDHHIDLYRDSETAGNPQEVEANKFAAALLMPAELVREFYSKFPHPEELARIFNVSEEAMNYRLLSLRLA